MPVWLKSLRGPHHDELVELRTLPDGLVACGFTKSLDADATIPQEEMWIVRADVDGMLHFDATYGFDAVNDAARWADTTEVVVADMPGALVELDAFESDAALDVEGTAAVVTTLTE
jgi:hypothetical protein